MNDLINYHDIRARSLVEQPILIMGGRSEAEDIKSKLMVGPRCPDIKVVSHKRDLNSIVGLEFAQVLFTSSFYHIFDEADMAYAKARVRCAKP